MNKTLKQVEAVKLLSSESKHILLYGGSRSGKTFILCYALLVRALKCKSRHVILRKHFNHVKQAIWLDTIPKVFDIAFPGLKSKCKWDKSDWYISLPNGSEVWIGGLDDDERSEKILGKEYSTIYFNECSEISYSSRNIALTRLAEKNILKKKAYYCENPPRKTHWSYKLFKEGVDLEGDPIEQKLYSNMLMNPYDNLENIDQDYIKHNLETLPPLMRKRFLEGEFTDPEDAIFLSHWFVPSEGLPEFAEKFTTIDPAISEKDEADETVICTTGIDYNNVIHEIETISGRWSFQRIIEECMAVTKRHKPSMFGVEYVAFQKALGDTLLQKNVPVIELRADTDKVRRAISVTDLLEQGRVRVNNKRLIAQCLDFPFGEHDDYVDAFVYNLRLIKYYSQDKYTKPDDKYKHLDSFNRKVWKNHYKELNGDGQSYADVISEEL